MPEQWFTLIGVAVGSLATGLFAFLQSRWAWQRESRRLSDERRIVVYADYGRAVVSATQALRMVAAARGLVPSMQSAEDEADLRLRNALDERAKTWELMSLTASKDVLKCASKWHSILWEAEEAFRDSAATPDQWTLFYRMLSEARDNYYRAARREIGVD